MRSALPPLVKPIVTRKVPFKRVWPYRTRLNWYKLPFRVWSLVLSSGCLPKFPSVLLIASSAGVKKLGRSLMAHLYRSVSDCRVSWTRCTFWGVTQLWTRSSVTGVELLLIWAGCDGSVGGTTGLTGNNSYILLKASSSLVKRSKSDIGFATMTLGWNCCHRSINLVQQTPCLPVSSHDFLNSLQTDILVSLDDRSLMSSFLKPGILPGRRTVFSST